MARFVKGAPESILERCTHVRLNNGRSVAMSRYTRARIDEQLAVMASSALRCLAFAIKVPCRGDIGRRCTPQLT